MTLLETISNISRFCMKYWSDEMKDYIKSLTTKKIFFANIPTCHTIRLKMERNNYDIILARSKTENFYIALNANDYRNAMTTQVPKELLDLMKKAKLGKDVKKNLNRILCFTRSGKEGNIIYIPPNNDFVEQFFKDTEKYLNRKDDEI